MRNIVRTAYAYSFRFTWLGNGLNQIGSHFLSTVPTVVPRFRSKRTFRVLILKQDASQDEVEVRLVGLQRTVTDQMDWR